MTDDEHKEQPEMLIETIMRHHISPVRTAIIWKFLK